MEESLEKEQKEKTMRLSIKEGSVTSIMSGVTDQYISPFALTINATNFQISALSSFSGLISPISQVLGSKLMEKYSRKKIIFLFVLLQAFMWLPILLLSLMFWRGVFLNKLSLLLIVFYSLYSVFGAIAGPVWFSLLGDIVPENIRGKYWSKRHRICSSFVLVSALFAAFLLDYFKTRGLVLIGFSILFFIAFVARFISALMMSKHYEPELKLEKGYYFSFFEFVKKAKANNFGKFVIFMGLFYFAICISSPFYTVYMLKSLNFSYTKLMLVNISATIFTLVFIPIFGKFSDKHGNKGLIKMGAILISIFPFTWLVSKNPIYLVLVPQLMSGIGWGAFNLATSNFIYDTVTPQRRGICVSYYNIFIGVGTFFGGIIGGIIANYLSLSFMNIFIFIFVISGIGRLLVTFLFVPKINEIKQFEKSQKDPFIYLKEEIETSPLTTGFFSYIKRTKEYFFKKKV